MENQENKEYRVITTEDCPFNNGDPINVEVKRFDNLEDAKMYYDSQLEVVSEKPGVAIFVELYKGDNDDEYPTEGNQLESGICKSKELPKEGVVLFYSHEKYMNYCYRIHSVELVDDSKFKTYEDLPYSEDATGRQWAYVAKNLPDFVDDFEAAQIAPFNKINSGTSIITSFLEEQGVEGYI